MPAERPVPPDRPRRVYRAATAPAAPAPERRPGATTERPRARASLDLAKAVVERASATQPADDVLRQVLRAEPGLGRETSAAVARLVFGYYRWRGSVKSDAPLKQQLEETEALADRFAREPETFDARELASAVPGWVGDQLEVTEAWLRSLQAEPRLWLRAKPGTAADLAAELGDCSLPCPELLPDALGYEGERDLFRCAAFHEGRFEVQDLASQMVGVICGPKPGENWWDACAGEGGKTLHLASLMANRGVVWASDRADWRLRRLRLRAGRAGLFNVRWSAWDGGTSLPTRQKFDGVLVDAPCSGLGTWQRNPHARWTTRPEDIAELAALQVKLLSRAATAVKPGGRLVYAVCTLARDETSRVAAEFAATASGFEPVAFGSTWAAEGAGSQVPAHHLWIRPEVRGSNGMFVAVWQRA